jgi:DNA gyrase/topoisomerase IV subunit B
MSFFRAGETVHLCDEDLNVLVRFSACRGKLLNVRDASALQITNNTEIQNIKQIMGLQHGKVRCVHGRIQYGTL